MTRNEISNIILENNQKDVIKKDGEYYITCFKFKHKCDVSSFYAHPKVKPILSSFQSFKKNGFYYIAVQAFNTYEQAKKSLEMEYPLWYKLAFLPFSYFSHAEFRADWYD